MRCIHGKPTHRSAPGLSPRVTQFLVVTFGLTVLALITFGFIMLASTSSPSAYRGDAFYFAKRQAIWLGIGLPVAFGLSRVNYHRYCDWAWPLLAGTVVLLLAVLVFGRRINGAARWLIFGPIRFQPSEFAKYALIIVLARWLERMQRAPKGQLQPRIKHWWWGVFAPLGIAGGVASLVLKEPDLGATLLLLTAGLTLLWLAGSPWQWLGGIVACAGLGITSFLVAILNHGMFSKYYQVQRIIHWWYWDDLNGSNYQQWTAMQALGVGGTTGRGLGNSLTKFAGLPEAHTDFILPIIGEELGLVATLSILAAFGLLMICGLLLARRAPDMFGFLLGSGIATTIGLQALINIAVVTGVIPNKGMALPFISYGGSNLLMTLAAAGILLSITRHNHGEPGDLR